MSAQRITARTIRPDFRRMPHITFAEAGELAGVSYRTIEKWARREVNGRRLFPGGFSVGPYQVDRQGFENYLKTGVPCGEIV